MATIKDFIEQISVDQFYSWWNNTAEKDVPQKVLNMTEKYFLIKENKKLPFKWVIIELAKKHQLEIVKFVSQSTSRDTICNKYDIDIYEEPTYNNTELKIFNEYFDKKILHKNVFQNYISYCHSIVIRNNIDAYKIRTSISNAQNIMLLIGMKSMNNYKDTQDGTEIGFIVSKEFYDESNYQLARPVFEFKGTYNNYFITFLIKQWEDIPQEVLLENNIMIAKEYDVVSSSHKCNRYFSLWGRSEA